MTPHSRPSVCACARQARSDFLQRLPDHFPEGFRLVTPAEQVNPARHVAWTSISEELGSLRHLPVKIDQQHKVSVGIFAQVGNMHSRKFVQHPCPFPGWSPNINAGDHHQRMQQESVGKLAVRVVFRHNPNMRLVLVHGHGSRSPSISFSIKSAVGANSWSWRITVGSMWLRLPSTHVLSLENRRMASALWDVIKIWPLW